MGDFGRACTLLALAMCLAVCGGALIEAATEAEPGIIAWTDGLAWPWVAVLIIVIATGAWVSRWDDHTGGMR